MKKVIAVLAIIVIGLCAYDVTMIILNNSGSNNADTVRLESTVTSAPTEEPTIDAVLEDVADDGDAVTEEAVTDDTTVDDTATDDTAVDGTAADDAAADDAAAEM